MRTPAVRPIAKGIIATLLLGAVGLSGACKKNQGGSEEAGDAENITVDVPLPQKDAQDRLGYIAALQAAPDAYAIGTGDGGKHTFTNIAYGLSGDFTDGKLNVRPSGGRSRWNLSVKALRFGYSGILKAVPAASEVSAVGNRLDIRHGTAIGESIVSGLLGVQYSVTYAADPKGKEGDDRLLLVLQVGGDLKASLAADGRTIEFRDGSGELVLRARDLLASSSGAPQPIGVTFAQQGEVFVAVSTKDAKFPLTVNLLLTPNTLLTSPDAAGDDGFGDALACSGGTAIVGSPGKALAYVQVRTPAGWKNSARLSAKDAPQGTEFGGAVAIDGTTAVIGAARANPDKGGYRGAAYIYTADKDTWSQTTKLQASEPTEMFGAAVALNDEVLVVGAPGAVNAGSAGGAYLFAKDPKGGYTEIAKLKSGDGTHRFGRAVAVGQGNVFVGAENALYVFSKKGNAWTQRTKVASPDGEVDFAAAITSMHDTVYVGAPAKGVVYPFSLTNGTWTQRGTIAPAAPVKGFGASVAANGTTVLVGSPSTSVGKSAVGSVSAFSHRGTGWVETARLLPVDPVGAEAFGTSVAMSGEAALVGTHLVVKCPPDCTPALGRAYSFVRLPAKVDGTKCTDDSECTSGVCADGVCCNERCDGACDSCVAANKQGRGPDGECGKAAANTDPRNRCHADTDHLRSCKADGMCDGEGKCRTVAAAGAVCQGPSCGGGVVRRGTCDGVATGCKVTVAGCAPYACSSNGVECRTSCAQDSDCAGGFACSGGTCRKK